MDLKIATVAWQYLRRRVTVADLLLQDDLRHELHRALKSSVDANDVLAWITHVELQLSCAPLRHKMLTEAVLVKFARPVLHWQAGTSLAPHPNAAASFLAAHIGARVVINDVGATLSAVLDDGNFVGSPHAQYYGTVTATGVCAVVTHDAGHPCVVVGGEQRCCGSLHVTMALTLDVAVGLLGVQGVKLSRECPRVDAFHVDELLARVRSAPPAPQPPPRKRHAIIFSEACKFLMTRHDFTSPRGLMMKSIAVTHAIRAVYPHKKTEKELYHAMRNVFQSSKHDEMPGHTLYTPTGLRKGALNKNVIWTYRTSTAQFNAKLIV